jgi:ferredoxin/biotin operon repressor
MAEIELVYKELAEKVGESKSQVMPKLLRKMANLEQAKIMNELPSSSEEIAKKLSITKEKVDAHLHELLLKGLVVPGKKGYSLCRPWGAMHDLIGSANLSQFPELDDEFFDLSVDMHAENCQNRIDTIASSYTPGQTVAVTNVLNPGQTALAQMMRVIPRWRTIKDIPGMLPMEDLREIYKQSSQPIVIFTCPCKALEPRRPCKDKVELVTCIQSGSLAQYMLNRGTGRKINTYEEFIGIIDGLDKYNLVNMVGNFNSVPTMVCNCHNDCCGAFLYSRQTRKHFNQYSFAKSRFIAVVDPEKCLGCKTCADKRCPVGASLMKYYPEISKERAYADPDECIGCGMCVLSCPAGARSMKLVRPPEHVEPRAAGPLSILIDVLPE